MSKRVRQLIFFVVFTSSVVGLMVLLLYSAGYRLDTTQWELQPTGSIRVAVEPSDDVFIFLLPTGESSHDRNASFTHLLPGSYHLYVEAADYQPVNFELSVEPNTTIILDPLRLWPTHPPERLVMDTAASQSTLTLADLPITLQAAISQLGMLAANVKLLPVDQHRVVVQDVSTGTVQLLSQTNHIVETRSLGSAESIALTNSAADLLLIGQFSLQRINIYSGATETVTRLSRPIGTATWLGETSYIAYSINRELYIIDSRIQTGYSDQRVAQLDSTITQLNYDLDSDTLRLTTQPGTVYRLPLSVDK